MVVVSIFEPFSVHSRGIASPQRPIHETTGCFAEWTRGTEIWQQIYSNLQPTISIGLAFAMCNGFRGDLRVLIYGVHFENGIKNKIKRTQMRKKKLTDPSSC